jgi:carboxymethylenebutenolidase
MAPEQTPKLTDLQQYLVDEYVEDYQEGALSRRDALRYIAAVTGSLFFAGTTLAACGPAEEQAAPAVTTDAGGTSAPAMTPAPAGGPAETGTAPAAVTQAAAETAALETTATTGETATASAGETAGATSATAAAEETVIATTATASVPASAATAGPPDGVRVAEDDPAIQAEAIEFPGEGATLMGYLARPAGDGTFPIILVCHENRGLTDYIRDVTRRLGKAGYVALAVDLLSRQGGKGAITDAAQIPATLGNSPPEQFVGDFRSGLAFVQSQPYTQGDQVGMIGFCFGGGITWRVATQVAELDAAVPFYGPNPPIEDVPAINAAVYAVYGELDERINAGIPEIEAAMHDNNKNFRYRIYPGVAHAFHNDTGRNYNPEVAEEAWADALAWFEQYVKGG